MEKSYQNDVDKEYKKSIRNEKIINILFISILILSIINIFFYKEFIMYLLIILNMAFVITSLYDDILVKNKAELERRKTLIANSFSINITEKKTNGYYNNTINPSIKKLGVNSFESTLHTRNNLFIMLIEEGIKAFIIFVVWIVVITKYNNNELFYSLTQTIFSMDVLFKFLKMIYYYVTISNLYNNFYHLFVTRKYNEKNDQALVIQYVMDYECIKSYSHILLSEKNFKKFNDELSIEWNNIQKNIK